MADTYNIAVSKTWTKIADDTHSSVTVQAFGMSSFELAVVGTETAPTVDGIIFTGSDVVTRGVLADGFIYARIRDSDAATAATLVVIK